MAFTPSFRRAPSLDRPWANTKPYKNHLSCPTPTCFYSLSGGVSSLKRPTCLQLHAKQRLPLHREAARGHVSGRSVLRSRKPWQRRALRKLPAAGRFRGGRQNSLFSSVFVTNYFHYHLLSWINIVFFLLFNIMLNTISSSFLLLYNIMLFSCF